MKIWSEEIDFPVPNSSDYIKSFIVYIQKQSGEIFNCATDCIITDDMTAQEVKSTLKPIISSLINNAYRPQTIQEETKNRINGLKQEIEKLEHFLNSYNE